MQDHKPGYLFLSFLTIALGCKETYLPPVVKNPPVNLVVEGFINSGPDSTFFDLSTSYLLSDSTATTPITGATVTVEGTDSSKYPLAEIGNGIYGSALPTLNPATAYRVHIITTAKKQYASDYTPLEANPPIDSINFIRSNSGVQVYANTHDPTNTAQYFRYDYQETWKFISPFFAVLQYSNDSVQDYAPNKISVCWHSDISGSIILATSTQLSKDVIYEAPIVNIPLNSQQISVKYSILVKQYAITKAAYNWWGIMQNNTENIGSIFGVQPSVDIGNLHCLTDTTEQVIGYVSAGTIRSQRIFITEDQVFPWDFISPCLLDSCPTNQMGAYYSTGFLPIEWETQNHGALYIGWKTCVDCTLTGTNVQPPFWQ
jgi:hypothetical protein